MVVDEADLLLSGSFQRDLTCILGSMRDGDRSKAEERLCAELGIDLEQFQQLPRHVQKQGLRGKLLTSRTGDIASWALRPL